MQYDPATTAIHTRSVGNVETERLLARLDGIRGRRAEYARACEQKNDWRCRVREVINIERELARRAVPFAAMTNRAHLDVDVYAVPTARPR